MKGGLLTQGEKPVDTRDARGVCTMMALGQGKHIYTMTPTGQIHSADPWKAHTETPQGPLSGHLERELARQRVRATGEDPERTVDTHLGLLNHSSFTGGKDVAGAGELSIDQGKLTQVSDQSGHYLPDIGMTTQVLGQLGKDGVDLHDVTVKLTPKHGIPAFEGNPYNRYLYASAREVMAQGGANHAEEASAKQLKKGLRAFTGVANTQTTDQATTESRKQIWQDLGMRDRRIIMGTLIDDAYQKREARLRPEDGSSPTMRMRDQTRRQTRVPATEALLDPRAHVRPARVDRSALPVSEKAKLFDPVSRPSPRVDPSVRRVEALMRSSEQGSASATGSPYSGMFEHE